MTPAIIPLNMIYSGLKRYWLLLLTVISLVVSQWQLLAYYWSAWSEPDGYYSHALLVPILAGIMVWQNRERLARANSSGSWLCIPILLLATVFCLVGIIIEWQTLCSLSLILFLYGIILSFMGRKVAIILFLPILFLCLMIPLSSAVLDGATSHFQIMSTTMAAGMLRLFDGEIVQHGNIITSSSLPEPLLIGVPCSGLKLLIALFMVTSFLAYSLEGAKIRRVFLIALALPLAILVNSIRIVMIGLVGMVSFSSEAIRSFHDYSGYIGLVLCAAIVMLIARLIGLKTFWSSEEGNADSSVTPPQKRSGIWIYNIMPLLCLCPVIAITMVSGYLNDIPKGHISKDRVPMSRGDWQAQISNIEPIVKETLKKGDLLSIIYTNNSSGDSIQLFVTAAIDMSAFHDPRVCIPSQGSNITKMEQSLLKPPGRQDSIPISTMLIDNNNGQYSVIVYWYLLGDSVYASTLQNMRQHLLSAKLDTLKKVALNPLSLPKIKGSMYSRQIVWCRFSAQANDYKEARLLIDQFISKLPKDFVGFSSH